MDKISYTLLDEQMTREDTLFYKQLGQRVQRLRKDIRMTQVQMAEYLEISQQQVAAFEAGQRKIPAATLPKLSQLFAVSLEELLGVQEAKSKRGPTPKLQRQLEQVSALPRTKQKFVMEMLDNVLGQKAS